MGYLKTAVTSIYRKFYSKKNVGIAIAAIATIMIAFQNCGKKPGTSELPSLAPLNKIETYSVSDSYACQVQVSTQEACKVVLDNYQGDFENIISPTGSSKASSGFVNINPEVSCQLLKNGNMQCASSHDDGTVEYLSNTIDGDLPLFDSNLENGNVCAAVQCGVKL